MNSEEYTSEDSTRKRDRDQEDTHDVFKRSKKLSRTPQKGREGNEKLIDMMKELMRDVKEMKADQKEIQGELRALRNENNKLKQENENMKKQMSDMEMRMYRIEKTAARNNVVISGLKLTTEDKHDMEMEIKNFMKSSMQVEVSIRDVIKMGQAIYKSENKKKLRQLKERVYINNELTKSEQTIQKKLKQIGDKERRDGKRAKIGYQKITIEGIDYKWDKEKETLSNQGQATQRKNQKN